MLARGIRSYHRPTRLEEALSLARQGVVPLARIVLAKPETRLEVLAEPRFISTGANAHQQKVAELFDKYNLVTLPVVDKHNKLKGVITSDDVISMLRAKM